MNDKIMQKVIRDGKVAVLVSPGFGGGWYTWNHVDELLFHPVLVNMVENGLRSDIDEAFIADLLGIVDHASMPYLGGADKLEVRWLPIGTEFIVEDYDGSEEITIKNHVDWLTA